MEFLNHQDLGPLFTLKIRNKGRKEQQQYYLKHRLISKRRKYVAADSSSDSDNVILSVKFPNIRSKSKHILNSSCPDASTDRATSSDAPVESDKPVEEFQATSPMVVDTDKASIDQDTQEPGSQRESYILPGHITQEPSIQSMDADRSYIIPDEQIYPNNAQGNLSLKDRELGLQLTVFSAATSLANLRASISGWNTQEPSVQSTEAIPEVQVPQEPSDQSSKDNTLLDDVPVLITPLNSRPLEFTTSGMNSVSSQISSDNMILS